MFSLHVDTARTWRGGQNQVLLTVNGLRSIGQRAALVAHPDGELRRRAAEGLDLIPIAPRSEMDLSAAWKFSRLLKRLQPDVIHAHDPHGVAMASLALVARRPAPGAGAAAGTRRVAARRLSPEGQLVLALEVPPGGLFHRRVRGHPPDARRRRRRGRTDGHRPRRDRRRSRPRRAAGQRPRSVLSAARRRRSSATSPRWCRTKGSAT